eukprot:scaffold15780_cov68-Phaeocystis_antarctica.AAC.14
MGSEVRVVVILSQGVVILSRGCCPRLRLGPRVLLRWPLFGLGAGLLQSVTIVAHGVVGSARKLRKGL